MTETTLPFHSTTDANNVTDSHGVVRNPDGTFTALTFTASKDFKTERGARAWYNRKMGR